MLSARHSFAAVALNDRKDLYVFGGVSGVQDTSFKPALVSNNIERYNQKTKQWEAVEINNAPKLSAFGWSLGNREELFILGGSNGADLSK